jgi:hypothetical protein
MERFGISPRLDALMEQADRLWSEGKTLPFDLASALMSFGVDVETLEKRFRQ